MRAKEFITDASYPGNIGAMEVAKFFMKATPEQKEILKKLMSLNDYKRAWAMIQSVTGVKLQGKEFASENFADGKKPGRKGLSKRVGIPKKSTLGQLEKIASSSTGERRRMAQWQLNMRRGKKK
jgi:hypothetical protein